MWKTKERRKGMEGAGENTHHVNFWLKPFVTYLTAHHVLNPSHAATLKSNLVICIAPYNGEAPLLKYGPCVTRGSHCFTCHPHTNHTCLYSPAARRHRPLAGTHCAYPRRDGQVELTWVAGHIPRYVPHRELNPDTVTHLSTNLARRWLTSLIEANCANHYARPPQLHCTYGNKPPRRPQLTDRYMDGGCRCIPNSALSASRFSLYTWSTFWMLRIYSTKHTAPECKSVQQQLITSAPNTLAPVSRFDCTSIGTEPLLSYSAPLLPSGTVIKTP